MSIATPYTTVETADLILLDNARWEDAEPEQKQAALEWATIYMQVTYSVPDPDGDSPDQLQVANALLANHHLEVNVFDAAAAARPGRGITEKTVKAGEAGATTKYDPYVSKQWVDPFPDITGLLQAAGYPLKKAGTISTVPMLR